MEAAGVAGRPVPKGTWAVLALVGVALYVVLDMVVQLLPPHYSPIRQAESDLGVGPYGWLMSVNFMVRGALTLAAATAIAGAFPAASRPRFGLALLWVFGVGSALLAFFPTDILDDPRLVPHPVATPHGEIHLLLALIAFIAAPFGALLISFRVERAGPLAAVRGAAVTLALLASVALLAMPTLGRYHVGGLAERVFLACVLGWLALLAATARGAA